MNFNELFELLKELEIIEYLGEEKLYTIRYDMALTKLMELSKESEYVVKWVKEDMNYIYFSVTKKDKAKIKKDAVKFFKLIGFIEICHEYDLECGPDETINEYNQTVIEIQKLAKKYGLYDEKKDMNDPWYDLYTLWPEMKEYFNAKLNTPINR